MSRFRLQPTPAQERQRKLARAQRGSNRRGKVKNAIARLKAREGDRRKDWVEKTSTRLAREFDMIAVEDLKIAAMKASGRVVKVDPRFTSQCCSVCGVVDREARESQAVFRCRSCGFACNADVNAALNIRFAAGYAVAARGGPPSGGPANREPQHDHLLVRSSVVGIPCFSRGRMSK